MTRLDHRRLRLYVDAPLGADAATELSAGQSHYLGTVMRRPPGSDVHLFNGRDGEWRARVDTLTKRGGAATCVERVREQMVEPDLWLLFAPIKRGAVDFVVEKATELGVSRLVPTMTRRTVAARVNRDRLRAHAIEAAEQSDRLSVPAVDAPAALADILAAWPGERRLLWADESGAGAPIADALAAAGPGRWAVLIGPEGGFDPGELDLVRRQPKVTAVSLGTRILRADTAAVAALACLQALVGDWHPDRRPMGRGYS